MSSSSNNWWDREGHRPSEVVRQTARWIVPAYALLLFLLVGFDRFDPGVEPNFRSDRSGCLIAWAFAESG